MLIHRQVFASADSTATVSSGSGHPELYMAAYVRERAEISIRAHQVDPVPSFSNASDRQSIARESVMERDAIEIFATSLERLVCAVGPSIAQAEFLSVEHRSYFGRRSSHNIEHYGLCASKTHGDGVIVAAPKVIDFIPAKADGMRRAVDTACVAIRSSFE